MNRRFEGTIGKRTPTGGVASALLREANRHAALVNGTGVGQDQRLRRELRQHERSRANADDTRQRNRKQSGTNAALPKQAKEGEPPISEEERERRKCLERACLYLNRQKAARERAARFYRYRHAASRDDTRAVASLDDVDARLHFDAATGISLHAIRDEETTAAPPPSPELVLASDVFVRHAALWTSCDACKQLVRTVDIYMLRRTSAGAYRCYHRQCAPATNP